MLILFKLRKPSAGLVAKQSKPKFVQHQLLCCRGDCRRWGRYESAVAQAAGAQSPGAAAAKLHRAARPVQTLLWSSGCWLVTSWLLRAQHMLSTR